MIGRFAFNHGCWKPTSKQLYDVFHCISTSDQFSSLKYAYRRDVKSFLAARLLVLYGINQCLSLDPANVHTSRDPNGRPYLIDGADFDFNLSHNGDFTLFTFCQNMRTGVDVMRVELPPASISVSDFIYKMKSLFSPAEFRWLNSSTEDKVKIRNFFRLWCLKEAFVKNSGIGLRIDVSSIDFDLTGDSPKCNFPGLAEEEWSFEEHSLPQNHVAAVVWHRDGSHYIDTFSKESFQELSYDQIMSCLSPWNEVEADDIWSSYISKEPCPPSSTRLI
ncbi:hypothetical protein Aperf_G00000069820 [Anoplocephala perfoliata]